MGKMSAKEVERQLGMQYAKSLKNDAQSGKLYQDCAEVINGSLKLLEHYNKIAMALKIKTAKADKGAAVFS